MVNLVLVQRAVAGRGGQHELTDKLDLGLKIIIGEALVQTGIRIVASMGIEVVILSSDGGHLHNLPVGGERLGCFAGVEFAIAVATLRA